jgi:signal transduction histidine kinase
MTLVPNLMGRIVAILLAGFVALQLLIIAATSLSSRGDAKRPYSLPRPAELSAMVAAIERSPPGERALLAGAFDNGLYSVRLAPGGVRPSANATTEDLVSLGRFYAAALPGHAVAVDARRPLFGTLLGTRPRPARFFAPVRVAVSLRDGSALELVSQPSTALRNYMRRRAIIGLVGGLALMVVLVVAMRQTTRPITRLARDVRRFGGDLDMPDLAAHGPREVRELALAFNEMKGRIRALMAERTRMLAAIAHDMRTYLTRLRLRADYIDEADHRARAVADLEAMSALLDDTLLLAQADAQQGAAEPVDLGALLRAAVEAREEDGARVALDLPETPLIAMARPRAVRRVVDNLLDNGLRHADRVILSLARRGGEAVIGVEDDGPGIAPELLARLGEPFLSADPARNRDARGGTGLGLAIVHALAARDGAGVTFANRAGGGLAVTLRYPLGAAQG